LISHKLLFFFAFRCHLFCFKLLENTLERLVSSSFFHHNKTVYSISAAAAASVSTNAENNNYILNSLKDIYGIQSSENARSLVRSRWMKLFHVQTFIGDCPSNISATVIKFILRRLLLLSFSSQSFGLSDQPF
jgi:hypothetical protein